MTVTINTLGTNSRQIVISGETSATNIINAVNTSLTALGWTLIDTVTSGSRGLQTTKVYSAPNADSVTTKYMIIRYDLHRQYWFVSCCESWNTGTNVATNESWYGGRQILLPLQYSNCILYVFATARYACFMGTVRSEPSAWQGIFEFERSAAEDIAAKTVPCFGWTSSLTIGEPYGNFVTPVYNSAPTTTATSANNGPVACGFAPPRTQNSLTGLSAANNFVIVTGLGTYPLQKSFMADWSSGGLTQALDSHCGMLGAYAEGTSSYVWNTNKSVINNLKLGGYTSFYPTGKIFGLKIVGKLGNPLDTTVVPVDANLFYDAAGVNTTHCLLGIHGGYKDKLGAGTNKLIPNVYTSGTALGTPYQSVCVSGRFIYITTSTGFHKFDLITLSFIYNILPAQAYVAVKFDGGNSLYVTTGTTTVYKLNLTDDTYTTFTSSVAISGIALDDDNLYAGSNVSGTTAVVKKIALSTFTESASWTITIAAVSQYITHMSTADYGGYLYIASIVSATRSNNRYVRILASDGTNSSITISGSTAATTSSGQPLFFDGDLIYFFQCSSSAALGSFIFDKIRISDFTAVGATVGPSAAVDPRPFGGITTLGCYEQPSFAGMQIIPANSTQAAYKILFSDPRIPGGLQAIPVDTALNLDTTNTVNIGQPATDHCSYYTFSTTYVIRYVGAFRNYNFNGVQTANLLIPQ